jgi:ribose 5-phosphate isomerase B
MRLAVGSDEMTHLTQAVIEDLRQRGHDLALYGPLSGPAETWPQVARRVAESVAYGEAEEGILFCWTGTGVSLAANKVPGIRAALCADAATASGARRWNNANVLCLSLRSTSEAIAKDILEAWFTTAYTPNSDDDACLAAVAELEHRYASGSPGGARPVDAL